MKISVIIPAFNAEKTLNRCIDSIINQTYNDLEIIIVNDGSTDNTYDICLQKQKEDKRIRVINNENHGVSYSRNYGIKIAKGDYITFVDADDYINEKCYETLSKYFLYDIDFIRYNFNVIGGRSFSSNMYDLKDRKIIINKSNKESLYRHFFTYDENMPCFSVLLLIKNSIICNIEFNENLIMMEDVDFYMQLINVSNNCYFVDKKLYNYCINSSSATHNSNRYEKNIYGIIDTNTAMLKKIPIEYKNTIINKINANHLRIMCKFLFKLFYINSVEYKRVINVLMENKSFVEILKSAKYTKIKDRILLFLIKNHFIKLQVVYLKGIKVVKNALKR